MAASGIIVFLASPKESLPEIRFGVVTVTTAYPQAAPQEVEKLITIPVEEAVGGIKGIDEITSASSEGISGVILKLKPGKGNEDEVINNIENAVNGITGLPDEAAEPEITELSTDEFPVIQVAVSGAGGYGELKQAADILEGRILEIKGVSSVEKAGYRDRVIRVTVSGDKCREYGLTIFDFINALRGRDIAVPAGTKVFDGYDHTVRVLGEIKNENDIGNVIIRSNEANKYVRVRDAGRVAGGFEEEDYYIRAGGKPAVILTVLKAQNEDSIRIVREIKKICSSVKQSVGGEAEISFTNDSSLFIKDRLSVVQSNGLLGAFLVFLVLLTMLRFRVALMTAVGLPVVFGASLLAMNLLNISYNMLSLFGFVMVIGILVDDAIVVGENSYRYIEKGKKPFDAAVTGATEMFIPVTASVATTIAAFFPLLFVGGVLGGFLRPIPAVIIIAVIISLIECYFILPAHIADFVKKTGKKGFLERFQDNAGGFLREKYLFFLKRVLDRKKIFISAAFLLLAVSVFLGFSSGFSFFSSETDEISVKVKTEPSVSLKGTEKTVLELENAVRKAVSPEDLREIHSYAGYRGGGTSPPDIRPDIGVIKVFLKLRTDRKTKDAQKIISNLRKKIKVPEKVISIKVEGVRREGGPAGSDVDIAITGSSYRKLEKVSEDVIRRIKGIKGLGELSIDFEKGKKEIRFIIDEKKAARAGVPLNNIGTMLRSAVAGVVVETIRDKGENIDVIVTAKDDYIKSPEDILKCPVPNRRGQEIPLKQLVSIEKGYSYTALRHRDGDRAISITGSVDREVADIRKVNMEIEKEFKKIREQYPSVDFKFKGEYKEMQERFGDLGMAFLAALFIIYIILASLFNSLTQPFIVMLAIPFGFMGVMLTLFAHSMPVSFGAFMGFIGLSGVVVNNSLILNDFINKMRIKGLAARKAVIEAAGARVRPVVLTTVTTAAGLLPLGYGVFGADDPFLKPVALVFAWGLLFSALVTLFIVPVFYMLIKGRGEE